MSRTVFFGKIPYDYTEEQVLEVAKSVGSVKEVRLVFDKDTAKSKGFAFVEYLDKGSAASAVRNLNNYQVGNQRLRVDFSSDDQNANHQSDSPIQEIAGYVGGMSRDEKSAFLSDFKRYSLTNPQQATTILEENPQLAYAIVQTLVIDQKIDNNRADQLVANNQEIPEKKRSAPKQTREKKAREPAQRQKPVPSPQPSPVAPVAQASTPQAQPAQSRPVDEEQRQMIMQVMSFTPQQIEALPDEQRAAILDLRGRVERGEIVL